MNPNDCYLPTHSMWANLPRETLKQYLNEAQAAYQLLLTGNKAVSLSYTQETGSKSVVYTQAQQQNLFGLIQELQRALGMNRRRAVGVCFR